MTNTQAAQKAEDYMHETTQAYGRGVETEAERMLRDAREGLQNPTGLAWQGYDPRGESPWIRECGRSEPPAPLDAPSPLDIHDDHVRRHYRVLARQTELYVLIELCWVHRTGKIQSVLKSGKVGGSQGVDRAMIAAEYLESSEGFGELLWPVVVAVAEGRFRRGQWGSTRPSFPAARALWNGFLPRLVRRLAKEPFEAYYLRRERELYTLPEYDHLEWADAATFRAA